MYAIRSCPATASANGRLQSSQCADRPSTSSSKLVASGAHSSIDSYDIVT